MFFDPLERTLWVISFMLTFLSAFLYFNRGYHRERWEEKVIMIGFSFFSILIGISSLSSFISDYLREGEYRGHIFYSNNVDVFKEFNFFTKLNLIFVISALVVLTLSFD